MGIENKSIKNRAPESEDEWSYIWSGAERAHAGWFVVKVQAAIFGNWKVLMISVIVGLALGGKETLEAWGILK